METTVVPGEADHEALFARVQTLQEQLDDGGESVPREQARELASALVAMYGVGLERILAALTGGGPEGERLAAQLAGDPFLATLLLIHDLHPVSLEQRVQAALESVRPYMESHGGDVELLSLQDGVARIGLRGSCSDCAASSVTLELAIRQALEEAAPDLDGLEVEGVAPQLPGVGLPMATDVPPSSALTVSIVEPAATPAWFEVRGALASHDGDLLGVEVAGRSLVIANVEGTLLAYRDRCAVCSGPLRDGVLSGGALECAHCRRLFFLPRAGRSMDEERVQLEPVPLLREFGAVRVALPA